MPPEEVVVPIPTQTLTVSVPPGGGDYPIYIGSGLLEALPQYLKAMFPADVRFLVVSDRNVSQHYGGLLRKNMEDAGLTVMFATLTPGETDKTLQQVSYLYDQAVSHRLSRRDVIVALGGGVVGDIAGFFASSFLRGLPFVQVPTTLLAQVDSSVGGKVGVNFRYLKNAVGAFYQPRFVLIDPDVLASLDARERRAGLAEVVKYAFIEQTCTGDTGFLETLEAYAANPEKDASSLIPIIARCCAIKAHVVMRDETEQSGLRAMLNLGHTFGHAYEAATHYVQLLHGEAVAIGMARAFELSVRLGLLPKADADRCCALMAALELPQEPPRESSEGRIKPKALLDLMRQDKKASQGQIHLVLPVEGAGRVRLCNDIAESEILAVIAE